MVSGKTDNVYSRQQFKAYKLAKSPLENISTQVSVQELEKMRKMREYVYVWFNVDGLTEKMWVRIISGDRKKGMGKLDNVPSILEHLRLGDLIRFETDKEGITWGL